jgi:hypothetical protein
MEAESAPACGSLFVQRILKGEDTMKSKITALVLGVLLVLATAVPALADNQGPNPQPPKCVPASTPGCSGKH